MKKAVSGVLVAPVLILAGCSTPPTLEHWLGGEDGTVAVDLGEAYPSAKSLFIVCTDEDEPVSDVFGRNVLEDTEGPDTGQNWMVQQRFDSAVLVESYARDKVDLCHGDEKEIREVTNEVVDFTREGDTWVVQGERGTHVDELVSNPVE